MMPTAPDSQWAGEEPRSWLRQGLAPLLRHAADASTSRKVQGPLSAPFPMGCHYNKDTAVIVTVTTLTLARAERAVMIIAILQIRKLRCRESRSSVKVADQWVAEPGPRATHC